MDRNTGEKSCADIASDFCGYVSNQWNRFCIWLSINVPLFFRRMRRWNWRPTFSNCFKSWKNDEDDKRNLRKLDVEQERTHETFEVINKLNQYEDKYKSNLKHRASPIRGSSNPLAISVVRVESMNSDDAKEVERINSKKMVKVIRNPETKKTLVVVNKERVPTPIPLLSNKEIAIKKHVDVPVKVTEAAIQDVFTKLEQLEEESDPEDIKTDGNEDIKAESIDEESIDEETLNENMLSMTAYIQNENGSNNNLIKNEDINVAFTHTNVLDDNNYNAHPSSLMETVALHADDDYPDEEIIEKEMFNGEVSAHEDHEMGATVVDAMTNSEKFSTNLKNNLRELANLREGMKLWIDQNSQKLYSDNRYVGQSWTRSFSGQSKSKTIEFIQRIIETTKLALINDEEITELLENAKPGIKNIMTTYFNQSWYGKYDEVKILEQLILDMGWKSEEDVDNKTDDKSEINKSEKSD